VYESFYKLSAKPFRLSPDPQFFYPSAGHKRALSYLLYGLNQGEGFVVITGAPGTGKTTLAHKLLSQIDAQSVVVANLASTQIEAEDLLRLVAASFKLRSENVSKAGLLKDIESFLLARARERKRCLLVVDEAQNLPPRSIEELRMLSNFQVGNKALMQVFLLGQEQFRVMLDSPQFEQLRQRVIADYHLHPLDAEETRRYIEARLQYVGWQNDPQFDTGAHALIFEYTGGLPRRINMFCDRLLLYGYLEGLHTLTHAAVSSVIAELHNEILPRNSNVVFTPAERPGEPAAVVELRAPGPAAVRAPPTNLTPARNAVTNIAPPASDGAKAPKSALPLAAAAPRPAKPAEPVPIKTANAAPARTPTAASPREIPAPAIADFLLADQPDFDTMGDPPRISSSATPSLAGAESRWLMMVVSACAVLVLLAYWFYPSIHATLQRMQSPEAEGHVPLTRETGDPADSSAGLAQQITDPSENVLTEKRILTSPASATTDSVTANAPNESPRENNELAATQVWWEHKVPAANVVSNKPATHAVDPSPKTTEQAALKAKPGVSAVQLPATLTTTTPARKPAPAPTLASAAPSAGAAPTNVISERELTLLVIKFTRYYEEGNLPLFLSLFDQQVRTEDSNSIDAIRNDYSELFKKTAVRQILLGDIHWENAGRLAQGTAPFEVRISAAQGEPARSLKGDITFHIEKKDGGIVIIALYHTPR